ncbi:MAG: flagellar biosynthesis protein FlhF [Thermodesulfobacteriota bacterium]
MKIKRYQAPDIQTALAMIKRDLGEDALILTTRPLGGRHRNGRGQTGRGVEVVAAVDPDGAPAAPPPRPAPAAEPAFDPDAIPIQGAAGSARDDIRIEAQDLSRRFSAFLDAELGQLPAGPAPVDRWLPGLPPAVAPRPASQPAPAVAPPVSRPSRHQVSAFRDEVLSRIACRTLEPGVPGQPLVLALVGATGVGKTTTAAKLAAWYGVRAGFQVALLSMDCYRIGATEQLRAYARVLRQPCEVVLRRQDLAPALARHRDRHLVIIDTAGRSPYHQGHVDELAAWLGTTGSVTPLLVLASTTRKEDTAQLLTQYAPLAPAGLVLTKLDETRAYAALGQEVAAAGLPLTFLACGQRVPNDLLAASPELITALFTEGWPALSRNLDLPQAAP